jgi:L-threonylcarbamoyladenylate synthase
MRILRSTQRSKDEIVAEVASCVRSGGTVIFPTETVYGIGCNPENSAAIDEIFSLKQRNRTNPLALHVSAAEQASAFVLEWNEQARTLIDRFWPGPVAVIVKRKPHRYERAACSLPTISLRCPSDALCREILRASGPLAATSANRSGARAFVGADDDIANLPAADLAVLAGPTQWQAESTIVDCSHERAAILREGVITAETIASALGILLPAK